MSYDNYTPRRANKARWLESAPDYVLDVFDNPKQCDRYTVLFTGKLLERFPVDSKAYKDTSVPLLDMSESPTHPQGVSLWTSYDAHTIAMYRYKNSKRRIRWLDLPENIRAHVISRATAD